MKWKKMSHIGGYEGIWAMSTSEGGKKKTRLFVSSHWHFSLPKRPLSPFT